MESERIILGQIVRSKAGRDKDKYFVVMGLDGKEYALICDGELRKVEKPKRKKIKHLDVHNHVAHDVKAKIESNMRISNGDIKNSLKSLGLID
ncbi:hypothetical protein OXPF_37860 [Oxobacter pfennigii]|uniref:50S ribosomal protein L14e n=1 Tax=Oxobacter pfennigii TaxID=36849 RepID=A0A0P9ABY7_9CLOT|nr:KOW domain-containing RNA-binding protein [Oxobacter pfennigii]KPU42611.1 hypothetical protein OXPF_37860 [Oxobacter pfennigii]